jgi:hypothetical protein
MVLETQAISSLVVHLSDNSHETRIDAACAIANLTLVEKGKLDSVEAGAIPPLVAALGETQKLTKMAVRAVRNMVSVDAGRRATLDSNGIQPLVALLDCHSRDPNMQWDVVTALCCIASDGTAKKTIRSLGTVEKLKGFSNSPRELETALGALRDKLSRWNFLH